MDLDGGGQKMELVPDIEKLCTTAVEHTRGHIARLREMVNDDGGQNLNELGIVVWQSSAGFWWSTIFTACCNSTPGEALGDTNAYLLFLPRSKHAP